jgi:hypothetical protein
MKVAILLTGQLRTFEMVKYLHMNALILKYNADVFLGIDIDNNYQCEYKNSKVETNMETVKNAIHFFKPIDSFVLHDFTDEINKLKTKSKQIHLLQWQLLFRQYYVVKNTYKLLINHIKNNDTKYDLIIRMRFDQYIFSTEVPICPDVYDNVLNKILYNKNNTNLLDNYTKDKQFIFDEVNDNTIYVFGFGNYKHYNYANDQFFYHTPSVLIKMFEFYDNMISILKYCYQNKIANLGACIECVFYLYVTKFNSINLKQSNIHGIFVREFN